MGISLKKKKLASKFLTVTLVVLKLDILGEGSWKEGKIYIFSDLFYIFMIKMIKYSSKWIRGKNLQNSLQDIVVFLLHHQCMLVSYNANISGFVYKI